MVVTQKSGAECLVTVSFMAETKTDSDSFQTGLTTVDVVFKNETFIYL